MMNTSIRPARPDDAAFLAWIMLMAARSHLERGLWDIFLGSPERECLTYLQRLALTEPRSWAHYSGFLIAEVDGHLAAGLCGYDPQQSGRPILVQAIEEVANHLNWSESHRAAAWERFSPAATCLSEEPDEAWIVENVATRPEFRRRGLVNALLIEILEQGRQRGHHFAQISVLINNTPAQRAYEKVGFQVADEKRHPDFEAVVGEPGMRRLLRNLFVRGPVSLVRC